MGQHPVALVTGGAKGLGFMTCIQMAKDGCDVVVNYRHDKENAQQTCMKLRKYGVTAMAVKGDVGSENDNEELIKQVLNRFEKVDILIHNAGPYIFAKKKMTEYTIEEWNQVINGNLFSFFHLAKLVLPHMRKQKWGRIISMGFDRAQTAPPWPFRSVYAAAKVGLVSLTKTLALEEAKNGITVNMVCPGDIVDPFKEEAIQHVRKIEDREVPVGRPGTGEDIARVISFLCHPDSDFITGNVVEVTGGKDVLGKLRQ